MAAARKSGRRWGARHIKGARGCCLHSCERPGIDTRESPARPCGWRMDRHAGSQKHLSLNIRHRSGAGDMIMRVSQRPMPHCLVASRKARYSRTAGPKHRPSPCAWGERMAGHLTHAVRVGKGGYCAFARRASNCARKAVSNDATTVSPSVRANQVSQICPMSRCGIVGKGIGIARE